MADQPDLINRDPSNMNDHVKVAFEDVLAEPDGIHSYDMCWKCAYMCFNGSKGCCYGFMTFFCTVPMSLAWGCTFACISFNHIWHITPCLRVFSIQCGCMQKFFGTCISCCLSPLCETFGLFFSRIVVKNS